MQQLDGPLNRTHLEDRMCVFAVDAHLGKQRERDVVLLSEGVDLSCSAGLLAELIAREREYREASRL